MPRLDEQLPESLRLISEHVRLGPDVPCLVVRPTTESPTGRIPFLVWMHGRTATKELDPGRYLRLARAGIGSCAIDLPGHGERRIDDGDGHDLALVLDHIEQAVDEIDDDISPEPSTATVDAGQSMVDPTRSAPHLLGQAAWRYCVMPLVVDDP